MNDELFDIKIHLVYLKYIKAKKSIIGTFI